MTEKIKAQQLNFRLTEDAMEEFKKFAEERHISQTDAFQLAFTALKTEKKKEDHPENSKAIGEAQRHASNLIDLVVKAYDEKSGAVQAAEDKFRTQLEELAAALEDKKAKLQELEAKNTELEKQLETTKKSLELANTKQELDKTTWEKSIAQIKLEESEKRKPLELKIAELEGRLQEREEKSVLQ